MLESKFLRSIIEDILSTPEYNLQGIAHYTHTHEYVVQEVYISQKVSISNYRMSWFHFSPKTQYFMPNLHCNSDIKVKNNKKRA